MQLAARYPSTDRVNEFDVRMRGGFAIKCVGAGASTRCSISSASVSIPGSSGSPWIAFGSRSFESCSALKPSGPVFDAPWHAAQSLLEGMAAGLVPVVSDIAGNREWVTHRREGLLVPVGDAEAVACALAEVARDTEAAGEMAGRALAQAALRARFDDTVAMTEERLRALAAPVDGSRPGAAA